MESVNTFTLMLRNLNCYLPDESDGDEVYIKFRDEKIWPEDKGYEKVNSGTYPLDLAIPDLNSGDTITLELWEHDLLSPNDLLGTFEMQIDQSGGPYNTDLKINQKESQSARYNLEWKISH